MNRTEISSCPRWVVIHAFFIVGLLAPAALATDEPPAGTELVWLTDYADATQEAERQKRMLLIHFVKDGTPAESDPLMRELRHNSSLVTELERYTLLRLPLDAKIKVHGEPVEVLGHQAFAEMGRHEGLAVVDFMNEGKDYYGRVVSCLPFKSGSYYRFHRKHIATVLKLPAGTQTQRALVFAVRIHPEAPASTQGDLDPHLVQEAKHHSEYQARIRSQGHHHWEARFPRIARLLPFGLRPQEVVAESWPHEGMLDAAVDCVHSWRQSSGHWGAVKRDQPKFAYDMHRGSNGIWYATGIFGNRH